MATVRRMEGAELHPVERDGVWYFDPVEVAEYAAANGTTPKNSDPGRVASAVFTLLDGGVSFREIVRRTCQPPDVVRALYRDWRAGFEPDRVADGKDEEDIEAQRARDDEELRRWEKDMQQWQEREEEEARRDDEEVAARRARRLTRDHLRG